MCLILSLKIVKMAYILRIEQLACNSSYCTHLLASKIIQGGEAEIRRNEPESCQTKATATQDPQQQEDAEHESCAVR